MQSACFLHLWHHYPKSDFVSKLISGIQQIGIGVSDVKQVFNWYNSYLGFDIPVFNEAEAAPFMINYTGNVVQRRHAILAMNLQGGGGLEIWQFTSKIRS